MWISAESSLGMIIDAAKLDTIYVKYKGNGNYAVVGTIGDRDLLLETLSNQKEAVEYLGTLKAKLEID